MSELMFLDKIIKKKEKGMKNAIPESMALAGIIGGLLGYLFAKLYTACMINGTLYMIFNVILFVVVGLVIGYFEGKSKKEELQTDLMLLQDLASRREETPK